MFDWVTAPLAAFFGFFTGVLVAAGVMAAVYWINRRLMEKSSERRRLGELTAAAASLRAELAAVQQSLKSAADKWRGEKTAAPIRTELSHLVQLFPQMGAVVAQFPEGVVAPVVKAYALIADYRGFLYLHGIAAPEAAKGDRFMITPERARVAAKVNDSIARRIQQAIDALDSFDGARSASAEPAPSDSARALQMRRVGAKTPVKKAPATAAPAPAKRKAAKVAASA